MWRAAARWCRSPAMTCRCNTPPACCREHLHTRPPPACSTSRIWARSRLRPKSGKVEDAALALERLVPQDIVAVAPGRQRYAQFTNDDGGILDDLMVANFGDHLFLVVNAACKAEDEAHLRAHLSDVCDHRFAGRTRADRAAGAEGRIGAGEILCRRCRRCASWMPARAASLASTASSRAPAIPARTALRFRFRPTHAETLATGAAGRTATCCRSDSARATACGWRPGSASTAMTSTPRRRRSKARWNGRSRRAAATAARAPAAFPARTRSSRSSRTARRAAASA